MGTVPTSPARERDWEAYSVAPPPPIAPAPRAAPALPEPQNQPEEDLDGTAPRPAGHQFDAEMDATELDERDRPGSTWTARGRRLSRSNIVIRSRRMCYAGKRVLMAVHLIDSEPVPLLGIVQSCEYEGEGLYLIGLDLLPVPDRSEARAWIRERNR